MKEQYAIADALSILDDKIDLNRQMNRTLESLAAALFRAWFVDFEPVRGRAEGRPPLGIDAETAALFPDRLVPSEVGEIPEGWEISSIGELASILGGSTPSTGEPSYWGVSIVLLLQRIYRNSTRQSSCRLSVQLQPRE